MNELKFMKTREVKSPERGTKHSAGIDFFIPKFNKKFWDDTFKMNQKFSVKDNKIVIAPSQTVLIPSGIKVAIPHNKVLVAFNKSGVASKLGLDIMACVVDEDYQNEVFFSLNNSSDTKVILDEDKKIIQFLLLPVDYEEVVEYTSEIDLYVASRESERIGGLGSTGE